MTTSPDTLRLETPEQVEIEYELARLGSRFIAAMWDTLALVVLLLALGIAGFLVVRGLDRLGEVASNWGIALLVLFQFGILWGYYVIFETIWNGQTPGKWLANIRTVRADGYPIGFAQSAIRNLVRVADFLPGFYALGVAVMFLDRRSRRLGDFAAGTVVVHERPVLALGSLTGGSAPDMTLLEPRLPHLERINPEETEAVRRFLQRHTTLINSDALAAHLATRLRARLELETSSGRGPAADLHLLRQVAAQYEERITA